MAAGHEPTSHLIPAANLSSGWEDVPSDPREFLAYMETTVTPEMLLSDRSGQARLTDVLQRHFYSGPQTAEAVNIRNGGKVVKDQETDLGRIPNPTPEITLEYTGNNGQLQGSEFIRGAFKLKEDPGEKHYYFFRPGNPIDTVPPYLRPSDVVPSGTYTPTFPADARARMMEDLGINDETLRLLIYNRDPKATPYQVLVDVPFNKPLERVAVTGGHAERYNYVEGTWEPSLGAFDPGFRVRIAKRIESALGPKLKHALLPELHAD